MKRKVEEIVLPTDKFVKAYRAKSAEYSPVSPMVPIEAPDKDPAAYFAAKQYEWMGKGAEDAAEAERMAAKELEAERTAAIDEALGLVGEVEAWLSGRTGVPQRVPLVEWKSYVRRLKTIDWQDWSVQAAVDLDSWLVVSVLGWSWRLERRFGEEAAIAETDGVENKACDLAVAIWRLRRALFGVDLIPDPILEQVDAPSDNSFYMDSSQDLEDPVFDELQARAESKPLEAWTRDEVDQLDAYITKHVKEEKTLAVIDPSKGARIDPGLPVERLRLELFPELCPTYERFDGLPSHAGDFEDQPEGKKVSSEDRPFTFDPDGKRIIHVRNIEDSAKMATTLARHGIYPENSVDDFLNHVEKGVLAAKKGKKSPGDDLTSDLQEIPLDFIRAIRAERAPGSYAHQRLFHARKALREHNFLDRIYATPGPRRTYDSDEDQKQDQN